MSHQREDDFLRRLPSRYALSVMSGTDSTMSDIPGAGRTVGSLISSAGRRIEPLFSRAAERLGFGPTPLVRRFLALVLEQHKRKANCTYDLGRSGLSVGDVLNIAVHPCWSCRRPVEVSLKGNTVDDGRGILMKLLRYLT